MDIEGVWQRTTGRPDVAGAILDSGIRWASRDVSRTVLLNAGELPVPSGCASHDCDGNGHVDDIAGDGRVEIVVASIRGLLYVFDDHGHTRAVRRTRSRSSCRGTSASPTRCARRTSSIDFDPASAIRSWSLGIAAF